MSVDHRGGKGYTPLPQSISNTDTEDEEECLAQPNETHKSQIQATTEQTTVQENGAYYPLDETKNVENHTRNRQSTLKYYRDDIPIMVIEGKLQNDLWKRRDMSLIRRICLVASVLLCIATIFVFLYVLPCDNSMVCLPVVEPQSSISWDKTLQGVEIHGPITIVPGNPYYLILLLRGQRYRENDTSGSQRQISPDGGGVMSMQGNSGLPLWLVSLKRAPSEIDCSSIDTDRSGKPDCIVTGEQGLLVSIDPIAGTIHWSSKVHTFEKLPVILPDIDSDGVDDFLSIEVVNAYTSNLVLLSGATGALLGRYSPRNCSTIDIYNLVVNETVNYVCHGTNGKHVMRSMSFKGLLHAVKLTRVYKRLTAKTSASPRIFETSKDYDEKNSWRPTPYHHLSIQNEGTCPGEFCKAYVNLTLQKSANQSIMIWDRTSQNSFASKPAFIITPGKPYTTGFAIKFWQWMDTLGDHIEKISAVAERKLIERVLIVSVNQTDLQVMIASQTDITQLCQGNDCQPNLNSRARFNSISITNISTDGYPELISYWSSYDVESPKLLTSKVQVIKLDSVTSFFPYANIKIVSRTADTDGCDETCRLKSTTHTSLLNLL